MRSRPRPWERLGLGARLMLGVVLLAVIARALDDPILPSMHYELGARAAADGEWERARAEFDAARDLRDARERARDARANAVGQRLAGLLAEADARSNAGDVDGAIAALRKAGAYQGADQLASQLEQTRIVLDVIYGQMTASAARGQLDKALELSAVILRERAPYRDVGARRAAYLDRLYTSASASLGQGDNIQAVKLLRTLLSAEPGYRDGAEKLRRAESSLRRPLPGGYAVDQILRGGEWEIAVKAVVVQPDGRITAVVTWKNDTRSDRPALCGIDRGPGRPVLLAEDTRSFPTETTCSVRAGELVAPGKTYAETATFPPLADATRPFRVDWYGLGTSRDIVLVQTR